METFCSIITVYSELIINYVDKFVNCTRNCLSFSEEPVIKEENESYKRSAAGINS